LNSISGNKQVGLSWNAASYATSYTLNRATSIDGTYGLVASGLTLTNYTDATVTNGIIYYYTISALNRNGASTNSAPVSALLWEPLAQIVLSNGAFKTYCSVTQNQTCVLEASTNLLSGWFPIITNTAASNGSVTLFSGPATVPPQRFFRIKYGN
jgi:hypothetical protein